MRIAIVGTGYVGLVSGAGFSDVGLDVTCIDIDEGKIARLTRGEVPIYEPGLEELLQRNAKAGRLRFTSSVAEGTEGADVVFLAVGTPMADNGDADLRFIFQAAKDVIEAAKSPLVLVTKSTVPVGTADRIRALVSELGPHKGISVASNPEFLKEGDAVADFLKPERIIIGTDDEEARALLERLYNPFVLREHKVLFMDTKSAELTKYAANAMLAARISFMNEIAGLCECVGANIDAVRKGLATDSRIGSGFLYAGVGYGGSCFPKDVRALAHTASTHEVRMQIVEAVDAVNRRQRGVMLEKVLAHFHGDVSGKCIAVWGIAFKPRTDDIREAPAITLIEGLLSAGARVRAFDRAARDNARAHFGERDGLQVVDDEYAAVDGAHALVLMTEWPEFRLPDWKTVKGRMVGAHVFDGRNIYDRGQLAERGFTYEGIGRGRPR
jgi:UDPglucose 6-dehydrogenase